MYGHPFRHLNELNNGDQIIIYTSDGKFVYQVLERKIVRPTDLSVINQSRDTQLTLTTCHPIGSARQRLVVVALLEES